MKVLFATAECWPFVKTGGLGDVSYALPKALKKEGVDVRVILPKYSTIPNYLKEKLKTIAVFNVSVAWREQYCGLLETEIDGVKFYFIDNEHYFKRDNTYIYGYGDDCERYAFFNEAILKAMSILDFYPDTLQLNDWHTGLLPLLLKKRYAYGKYKDIKTVYTIHNLLYQGVFSEDNYSNVVDCDGFYQDIEYFGGLNFMKCGISLADKVTTVSPTYSGEIQTDFYGETLNRLLSSKNYKLSGILNGIDYDLNNPENDDNIYQNYNIENVHTKKVENKLALQKELGLEVNKDIPMIGIISRLVSQKGLDLISCVMPQIMSQNVQVVVLGTGEQRYESMFNHFSRENPNKLFAAITFDASLAQKIYASTDMFLMPSLFEPCGIGQLIAMRYGSLPIVRETGGLKDTIIPYNEYTNEGDGFSFKNYNAHEMLSTIEYAVKTYHNNRKSFNELVLNAMKKDNSWEKSAKDYKTLYNNLCK